MLDTPAPAKRLPHGAVCRRRCGDYARPDDAKSKEWIMSKRTPGPWGLRGYQIRADGGAGAHIANYQISIADGRAIAAVPVLLELLDAACNALDAAENSSRSHCTADDIRERLCLLGIWSDPRPDADFIYPSDGRRYRDHDAIDLNPDSPWKPG